MGGGGLATLLAALAALFLFTNPAAADPGLWVAHANGSTIFLFGTVHALKPGMQWRELPMEKAFASSDDLWVEVAGANAAEARPLVRQLGLDPAHPLSSLLTPEERQELDTAARSVGMPGAAALEPMRPWLAGLTVGLAPFRQAGYDPESGVDKALQADAKAAGKPVEGFETLGQQLHFFADLPQSEQLDLLREVFAETGKAQEEIGKLIDAWSSGDVEALSHMDDAEIRERSPALYKKLLVDRNNAWAGRLARLSHQPGTHFVAVGAAHLAGPDSLQNALEKRGMTVTRLSN